MITAEQIPEEVVAAAERAYSTAWATGEHMTRAAILAALNAWQGAKLHTVQAPDESDEIRYTLKVVGFILPLSQKEPRT